MPQFYTSIINDQSIDRDEHGQSFESADAAIAEAQRSALDLLAEHMSGEPRSAAFKVFVEDADRKRLATVSVMGSVIR
jgi:hypothetical protein